jgi:hypothetical protein
MKLSAAPDDAADDACEAHDVAVEGSKAWRRGRRAASVRLRSFWTVCNATASPTPPAALSMSPGAQAIPTSWAPVCAAFDRSPGSLNLYTSSSQHTGHSFFTVHGESCPGAKIRERRTWQRHLAAAGRSYQPACRMRYCGSVPSAGQRVAGAR